MPEFKQLKTIATLTTNYILINKQYHTKKEAVAV